jgi:hypothetical protein
VRNLSCCFLDAAGGQEQTRWRENDALRSEHAGQLRVVCHYRPVNMRVLVRPTGAVRQNRGRRAATVSGPRALSDVWPGLDDYRQGIRLGVGHP